MSISLTDEQRIAVRTEGNTWIVACPGSGKTRVALAKALREAPQYVNNGGSVLMLSFSVAAKDEIAKRVAIHAGFEIKNHIDVATIHGFCLGQLIIPFGERYAGRPLRLALAGGDAYTTALGKAAERVKSLPTDLEKLLEYRRRGPDGKTYQGPKESTAAVHAAVVGFWEILLEGGFVDYPNALYVALEIVRANRWIRNGLSARFPLVIVDEFQDCTDIQIALIGELAEGGSNVVLIGDLHQCVYGFAGADVDILKAFAEKIDVKERNLFGTHRCPAEIVAVSERIFKRDVLSVGDAAIVEGRVLYDHSLSPIPAIQELVALCDENGVPRGEIAFVCTANNRLDLICGQLSEVGIPATRGRLMPEDGDWFAALVDAYLMVDRPRAMSDFDRLASELVDLSGRFVRGALSIGRLTERMLDAVLDTVLSVEPLPDGQMRDLLPVIEQRVMDSLKASKAIPRAELEIVSARLAHERDKCSAKPFARVHRDAALDRLRPSGKIRGYTFQGVKGLQFEAVALVDISRRYMPFYTMEDLWDDARKLYVGATRSKRFMSIHAPTGQDASMFLPMIMGEQTSEAVIGDPMPDSLKG